MTYDMIYISLKLQQMLFSMLMRALPALTHPSYCTSLQKMLVLLMLDDFFVYCPLLNCLQLLLSLYLKLKTSQMTNAFTGLITVQGSGKKKV